MSAIKIATFFAASVIFSFGAFSIAFALDSAADAMCNPYFEQCPCGKVPKTVNGKETCVDGGSMKANTHGCPVGVCFDTTNGHVTSGICIQANKCQGVTCDGKPCAGQNMPYTNDTGQQCFTGMSTCYDMSNPPSTGDGTGVDTTGTGSGTSGGTNGTPSSDFDGSGLSDTGNNTGSYTSEPVQTGNTTPTGQTPQSLIDQAFSDVQQQPPSGSSGATFNDALQAVQNWNNPSYVPQGTNGLNPNISDVSSMQPWNSPTQGAGDFFSGGNLPSVSPSTGFDPLPQAPLDNSVWDSVNNVIGPVLTGLENLVFNNLPSLPNTQLSGGFPTAGNLTGGPQLPQNQAPQGTPLTDSARATVYYPGGCTSQPGCSPGIEGPKVGDKNNLISKTTPTVAAGPQSGLQHGDIVQVTNNATGESTYAVVGDKCPVCGSGVDLTRPGMDAIAGPAATEANVSIDKIASASNYSDGVKMVDQLNGQNFAQNNWQNTGFLNNIATANNPGAVIQNASLSSSEVSWVSTGSGQSMSPIYGDYSPSPTYASNDWTMGSQSTFNPSPAEPYPTTPVQAGPGLAEPYPSTPVEAGPPLAQPYPTTPVTAGNLPPADPWGGVTEADWQKLALNENLASNNYFNGSPQDWAQVAQNETTMPADMDTLSPQQLQEIERQQLADRIAQAANTPATGPTTPLEPHPTTPVETGTGPLQPQPTTPVQSGPDLAQPNPTTPVQAGPSLSEPYPSGIVTSQDLPPLSQDWVNAPYDPSLIPELSKNDYFSDYFSGDQWSQENGAGNNTFADRFAGAEGPTDLGDLTQDQLQKYADTLSKGLEPVSDPNYLNSTPEEWADIAAAENEASYGNQGQGGGDQNGQSFADRFPNEDAFKPTSQENAGQNSGGGQNETASNEQPQEGSGSGNSTGCQSEACAGGASGDSRSQPLTPEQEEIQKRIADAEAARDKLEKDLNKLPQSAATQKLIGQAKAGLDSLGSNSPDPTKLKTAASALQKLEATAWQTGDTALAREIRAYNNQLASLNSQFEQWKAGGNVTLGQLSNGRDAAVATGAGVYSHLTGANLPGQITGMQAQINGQIATYNTQIDGLKSAFYNSAAPGLPVGATPTAFPSIDNSWADNLTFETAGAQPFTPISSVDWTARSPSSGVLGSYDYFAAQNAFLPSGSVSIQDNPFVGTPNQYVGNNFPSDGAFTPSPAPTNPAGPITANQYVGANWPQDFSQVSGQSTAPVTNVPYPQPRPEIPTTTTPPSPTTTSYPTPLPTPRPSGTPLPYPKPTPSYPTPTSSPYPTMPQYPSPMPQTYPYPSPQVMYGGYGYGYGMQPMQQSPWYQLGFMLGTLLKNSSGDSQQQSTPSYAPPRAPSPIPPIATSTLSALIVANPNPVKIHMSSLIVWNSSGAVDCQVRSTLSASPAANGVRGTLETSPIATSTTYTVTCVNDIGRIVNSSVTLQVVQ